MPHVTIRPRTKLQQAATLKHCFWKEVDHKLDLFPTQTNKRKNIWGRVPNVLYIKVHTVHNRMIVERNTTKCCAV